MFCKCDKIPRKQVQDRPNEFLGNKNNKKRFLGKTAVRSDHYMINIGSQRQKISGN